MKGLTTELWMRALWVTLLIGCFFGLCAASAGAEQLSGKACAHPSGVIESEEFVELGYDRNDGATHIYRWRYTTEYTCGVCGERVRKTGEDSAREAHVWNVADGNTCAYCGALNPCSHANISRIETVGELSDHADNRNGTHRVTVEKMSGWFCNNCYASWGYQISRHVEDLPHVWLADPGTGLVLCEACGSTGVDDCKHPEEHRRLAVVQFYENSVDNGDGTHNANLYESSSLQCDVCAISLLTEESIIRSIVAEPHEYEADCLFCSVCGAQRPGPAESPVTQPGTATLNNPLGKLAIYLNGTLVDYTGFGGFEGSLFYFEHGVIRDDMDGLTLIDGTWYNMEHGRFNMGDGMVFFEGAAFLVKGGVIDETQSGLIEYNGQRFVFSYGQFQPGVYGAWPDPISGRFVYVWAGQFYPITDLVGYDGQVFYFINGYLATDFVGTVRDFQGTEFNIVYGQAY